MFELVFFVLCGDMWVCWAPRTPSGMPALDGFDPQMVVLGCRSRSNTHKNPRFATQNEKKLRAHLPEFGFWKPTPPQKMHVAEVDGSNMGVYGIQATHFVHQDRFFYKILGFRV